jgi:hypothetical protein
MSSPAAPFRLCDGKALDARRNEKDNSGSGGAWRQGFYHLQNRTDLKKFTSWLGKRSYAARLEHLGIERIRETARENGKKGGRPPKKGNKQ